MSSEEVEKGQNAVTQNPFRELDKAKPPVLLEAEDELETNDIQFKALKQDVLLQMFEEGLQEATEDNFPASGNLFAIANRTGYFACGCPKGLIFGKTEVLRKAFEEATPKSTASLTGAYKLELAETPTHIRFTGDEKLIIATLPSEGGLVLECDKLRDEKSLDDATKFSFPTPLGGLIDLISNPSPQHSNLLAYISRKTSESRYGTLWLYDLANQRRKQIAREYECTCATFSHDGETLMICTRNGEVLYYNVVELGQDIPFRRPVPVDLPEPEGAATWIIQGVHWIDAWNQLVIYNPLTDPSEPPTHEYQAYIISNPSRLSTRATFSFEFIKLPTPPVDAFGNTSLPPWFWFQTLHNWRPGIKDLVLCSVTAGSDIGLLGRGDETDPKERWRIWTIEDENRRPTVPYDMEKNEETIVVGMQLDFTATKKIEKPLYPDEEPTQCDSLPILWLLNTSGQLAGWTVMYIPGIKAGERPVAMQSVEWQDQYWEKEREMRLKDAEQVDPEEQNDRALWEKEWQKQFSTKQETDPPKLPAGSAQPQSPQQAEPLQKPAQNPSRSISSEQTPTEATPQVNPLSQQTATTTHPTPSSGSQVSQPAFGQSPQLGANKPTAFGQTSQLGGTTPGQPGLFSTFGAGLNANRTGHVFGQSSGLGAFSSPSPSSGAGGFAKYSSTQQSGGSGFLAGSSGQTGSFLSGPKGGSFLQGGQTGSFLQGGQTGSFLQGSQSGSFLQGDSGNAFAKAGQDQGFAKFATPNRGFGATTQSVAPPSLSDGAFLASKPGTTTTSQFGLSSKPSLSERTQSLTSSASRTQSYDLIDDESEDTGSVESEETDTEESESDEEHSVRVDADNLNFGDSGFDLNLGNEVERPKTPVEEPPTSFSKDSLRESQDKAIAEMSPSSLSESPSTGDDEYVKVGIPSPTSPKVEKIQELKDETPALEVRLPSPKIPQPPVNRAINPPITIEKAIAPPNPGVTQPRTIAQEIRSQQPTPPRIPLLSAKETTTRSASPSTKDKLGLPQFVPIAEPNRITTKLSHAANLSDAFRVVIEKVSSELEKLSENANNLADYVEYQSYKREPKTVDDLGNPDGWTFVDLNTISQITVSDTKSVNASVENVPAIDESIQELEKSLKKMEAKKLELERFVRAVKDPEVRESMYYRKLAPDFARQQKEIRHSLQDTEEKFRDLASALTVLKASLADEKGSFGIHAPSTSGVYRVVNNVFSRLQILTTKVNTLENKLQSFRGVRFSSPAAESPRMSVSRSSAMPSTPVTKIGVARSSPARGSPGFRASPGTRGSPLRRTMLDERMDPWEVDEVIREYQRKQEFRKNIGGALKGRQPLYSREVTK